MADIGPANARLTVHTARQGMAARVGHDLVLEATRWHGSLTDDALTLEVDAAALEVREGHGGVKPLTDGDRRDIKGNLVRKVLRGDTRIAFASTAVEGGTVCGELTLAGTTRPVSFELRRAGGVVSAEATVVQSAFAIKPFTALMGALKVADEVGIRCEARLEGA